MSDTEDSFAIGFLLIDDYALLSFASAIEPLRAANTLLGRDFYRIEFFSVNGVLSTSSSGVAVNATLPLDSARVMDMFLVVGGGEFSKLGDRRIFKLLQRLSNEGVVLGGVSGGAVTLALSGIMQNRRLTTHWVYADSLRELMPDLLLEQSLYVIDRDRYTCAGGVAPVDMMNAILSVHHGAEFAQSVSDWFIHTEVRPSADPQRSSLAERYPAATQPVILAIDAMQNHISDPLELSQLARLVSVSPRQLNRLFREKLGQTTMRFYLHLRLETADRLLRQSSLKIIEVAHACGFVSAAHFSASFQKVFSKSPTTVRSEF